MKPAKILYFVNGNLPKPEDYKKASELGANVVFRNANFVPDEDHALEDCDGVAGNVPRVYAKKFPSAEAAVKEKTDQLKILTSKVGDDKAPEVSTKPEKTKTEPEIQSEKGLEAWNPNKK